MVTGITAVQGGRSYASALSLSNGATPLSGNTASETASKFNGSIQNRSSSNTLSVSSLWNSAPLYGKAAIVAAAVVTSPVWAPLAGISMLLGSGCTPDTTSATDGGVNPDVIPPRGRIDSYPAGGELCVWLDKDRGITSVTLQDGTGKDYVTALPSASQLEKDIQNLKFGAETPDGFKINAHYLPFYSSRKGFPQDQPTRHFFMSTGNAVFSRNGKKEADGFIALWQTGDPNSSMNKTGYFPDFRTSDPFYRASNLKATTSPLLFPEGGRNSWQSGANTLSSPNNVNILRLKDTNRMGPILAVGLGPEIAGDPLKRNISILIQNPTSKKYEWKAVIDGAVDFTAGGYGYLLGANANNTCSSFYPEITTDQDVKGDSDTVRALKEQIRQSKAQLATLGVTL